MRILIICIVILFVTPYNIQAQKPNILLILTDNQSYWELSSHGHTILQTPNIDNFAKEGVDFTQFYTSPYCSPSRAALLTGRYSLRSGVHNTIGGVSIMHKDDKTVANYLQEAGYKTAIFGKWHLGHSYPYQPENRGFDEVFIHRGGGIGQLEDYYGNSHIDAKYEHNGTDFQSTGYSTDILFGKAMEFIEANQSQPFFAFISTPATHAPYVAHPVNLQRLQDRGVNSPDNALYSMIENIDDNVGLILGQLDNLQLRNNTMVIVATDQGVNGRGNPFGLDLNNGLGYDPKHLVFCMIRYPPLTAQGVESKALTGMVDLMPTILDLAGIPIPSNVDGRSMRPIFSGSNTWQDDRKLIIQCPRARTRQKNVNLSVKTQKWRLVNSTELYDIEADWQQTNNVASQNPDVVASLTAEYDTFWNSLPPADELLSRHIFEGPTYPDTRLDAMDWYKGASPWGQGGLNGRHTGTWAIEVLHDGLYEFELRRYPKDVSMNIGAVSASIQIGNQTVNSNLNGTDDFVNLSMQLNQGEYDMTALFTNASNQTWGAYFAYVNHFREPGVVSLEEKGEVEDLKPHLSISNNLLYIHNLQESESYTIYNNLGMRVMRGKTKKFNISNLRSDIYWIRTKSGKVFKFLKI